MAKIKNHNKYHATIDNKKTLCGLYHQSNNKANSIIDFEKKLKDEYWVNVCCKKCELNLIK